MVKPKLHEIISATRCLPRVLSLLLFIICIWWGLISWVSSFPWNMTTIFVQWLSLHQGPLPVHIWNKFGLNGKYGGIDKTADRKSTYQVLTFAKGKGTHTYTCIFFTSYTCHSWKFENFWFWSWALTMFFSEFLKRPLGRKIWTCRIFCHIQKYKPKKNQTYHEMFCCIR